VATSLTLKYHECQNTLPDGICLSGIVSLSASLKVRLSLNKFMKSSIFQNLKDFAMNVFIASLGLPGSFFRFPVGFFFYDITY
jgi:hypothetical protein